MYLIPSTELCGESTNNKWKARGLKGWYEYKKYKKKIPLIGSIKSSDPNHFIKLFVPTNLSDSINNQTCDLSTYKELFITERSNSFSNLKWKTAKADSLISVNLEPVHNFSWQTEASIKLTWRNLEIASFNISELTKLNSIESIKLLATKEINGNLYTIFSFGYWSMPGSNGGGQCGAGYEDYIGFMKINNNREISKFEFFQTSSCIYSFSEDFSYDIDHPENGITKNNK